ncbi:MAG TPA: ABC transporter ATP-binding protein [Flavihumibacter sp.]|nr:ABC transporter ATP-binding protein [Flavihumibacter sp.]HQD09662.1 ABC transporter ATP-binding protein [Flavihumibacter sp.]
MIHFQSISKKFGRLPVLNEVSLTLEKGNCIALIGPNGCGKTTLIKSLLGMVIPDKGDILFNGQNIKGQEKYRSQIGYMPQIGRYPDNMRIGQVIDMIKQIRPSSDLDNDLYKQFDMATMTDKRMRTLSGGTIQKVSATLAFLFRPPVLILDEPTAGLDPIAAEILKEKIIAARNNGSLVLITSHVLSELEGLVNRLVFMQDGKVLLHEDIETLKATTRQSTIAKSITALLKNQLNG